MSDQEASKLILLVGELHGKVDMLIKELQTYNEGCIRCRGDVEKRLRKLEHSRSWTMGAAAALGFAASLIKDWVWK